MLGDFLTFPDVKYDEYCPKLKVVGLLSTEELLISNDGDPVFDTYGYEDVSGIPLSTKILKKNDFSNKNGTYYLVINEDYDRWEINIECEEFGVFYVNVLHTADEILEDELTVKILFVHELQHLFKNLHIKKEIKI